MQNILRDNIPKVPKNPRGGKLENDPDVKQPHSEFYTDIILLRKLSICDNNVQRGDYKMNEYEALHIFTHFVKKFGTDLCIFVCFILRLLKKISDFFGKY